MLRRLHGKNEVTISPKKEKGLCIGTKRNIYFLCYYYYLKCALNEATSNDETRGRDGYFIFSSSEYRPEKYDKIPVALLMFGC